MLRLLPSMNPSPFSSAAIAACAALMLKTI